MKRTDDNQRKINFPKHLGVNKQQSDNNVSEKHCLTTLEWIKNVENITDRKGNRKKI